MAIKKPQRYLPRPQDWEWEKLSEEEVQARLKSVKLSLEDILKEEQSLNAIAKVAREALWKVLQANPDPHRPDPNKPKGMLGEVQQEQRKMEAISSDRLRLEREKRKAHQAINEIQKRIGVLSAS